jgi:flagellar biosynthesis/type III secretory pathway protein FliH
MDTLFRSRRAPHDHGALFAEDFDLPRHGRMVPEPEVINPTYTAAELAEARAEAWAGGHAAGTAEAGDTTAASVRSLLDGIAVALRDARTAATAVAEGSVEAIARLLLDSLAKLFPALCERYGEGELCALIGTILPALAQEPTIVVRMNPMHTPALTRELDRLDPELAERVRLVPVEAIAIGDVRVSWLNGSATRDTGALWQQVQAVIEPAGLLSPAQGVPVRGTHAPGTPAQDTLAPKTRDLETDDQERFGQGASDDRRTPAQLPPNQAPAPKTTPTPRMASATIKETAYAD